MKLIVGLGNPGKSYEKTRHNVGFRTIDGLAESYHLKLKPQGVFSYAFFSEGEEKIALAKPAVFMNQSGIALKKCLEFFSGIVLGNVLVVLDDVNLPLGEIRLKTSGSSGGHHGLESIAAEIKSIQFPRLRIGVGREGLAGTDLSDFVLGCFEKKEKLILAEVLRDAAKACVDWALKGASFSMNLYNRKRQFKSNE